MIWKSLRTSSLSICLSHCYIHQLGDPYSKKTPNWLWGLTSKTVVWTAPHSHSSQQWVIYISQEIGNLPWCSMVTPVYSAFKIWLSLNIQLESWCILQLVSSSSDPKMNPLFKIFILYFCFLNICYIFSLGAILLLRDGECRGRVLNDNGGRRFNYLHWSFLFHKMAHLWKKPFLWAAKEKVCPSQWPVLLKRYSGAVREHRLALCHLYWLMFRSEVVIFFFYW